METEKKMILIIKIGQRVDELRFLSALLKLDAILYRFRGKKRSPKTNQPPEFYKWLANSFKQTEEKTIV